MMTRREKRKVSYIQLAVLLAVVAVLAIVYRYLLKDKITAFAENNPVMTSILMLTVLLVFTANVLYGSVCQKLSRVLTDEPLDFIVSSLPILCDLNISKLYYNNELSGLAPLVNLVIAILNFLSYWVGFFWMVFKYGFLIVYEPHFIWLIISFIIYFINICLRSYIIGRIIASYDDYVPFNHISIFYIIPIVVMVMEITFYLILGPVLALLHISDFFLKSSLFNFTALIAPFVLPIFSYLQSRYVCKHILYVEEEYDDYEFEEEDDFDDYE